MIDRCDMCGSKIVDKKCDCGTWTETPIDKKSHMQLALEEFHEMKRLTVTGDAPNLGCAVIFFRGDYLDCKEVEQFILNKKKRSFYEDPKNNQNV